MIQQTVKIFISRNVADHGKTCWSNRSCKSVWQS